MSAGRSAAFLAATALAATLGACSKSPPPPAVDAKKEQAEALERARHDAFGTQVQALDKAKALSNDINEKAAHRADDADSK
jgi:hypothetical protein